MSDDSTIGYGVLDNEKETFIKCSNEDVLFDNIEEAESLLYKMDNNDLTVVSVQNTSFDVKEEILCGELIEYQNNADEIVAYIRSGHNVYALRYELQSYRKLDNYTPF